MYTSQYINNSEIRADDYHLKYLSDYHNKRLIILDYAGDLDKMFYQLKRISRKADAGKIIAYIQEQEKIYFEQNEFIQEGFIEGYFRGEKACCFSYFMDPDRRISRRIDEEEEVLHHALQDVDKNSALCDLREFTIRNVSEVDSPALACFMSDHFDTYPTPVHDPGYIRSAIAGKYLFKIALFNGEIVCAASADCNRNLLNAEITDCLTHPDFRGQGLNSYLIDLLEEDLQGSGYITLFSLARAISPGMNRIFSKKGYLYGGRMLNNCSIMGDTEDMNIWSKMIN